VGVYAAQRRRVAGVLAYVVRTAGWMADDAGRGGSRRKRTADLWRSPFAGDNLFSWVAAELFAGGLVLSPFSAASDLLLLFPNIRYAGPPLFFGLYAPPLCHGRQHGRRRRCMVPSQRRRVPLLYR